MRGERWVLVEQVTYDESELGVLQAGPAQAVVVSNVVVNVWIPVSRNVRAIGYARRLLVLVTTAVDLGQGVRPVALRISQVDRVLSFLR